MWWHVPVVPPTQEADVGGSFEPERVKLAVSHIVPLYYSLGNTGKFCPPLKKNLSLYFGVAFYFSTGWEQESEKLS